MIKLAYGLILLTLDHKVKEHLKICFIPVNFLIYDKGIIIAKYMRVEDLMSFLNKL